MQAVQILTKARRISLQTAAQFRRAETDIRGQAPRCLSYITPDEADILKALGGYGRGWPYGHTSVSRAGGDDGQGNVGGDAPGGDVGTAGDGMGEGQGGNGAGGEATASERQRQRQQQRQR